MTTEQIDIPLETLQNNPGPMSDIEDGEIPNLENHSSPTLNKKAKKKSKSKKHSSKRKELENIDFNSSTSEQINSDNDSDDGWWSKKKRHLNDLKATRYHEDLEEENILVIQKRNSFFKEKHYHGKKNKFDEKNSPDSAGDSGDDNNKDTQLYPCKAYIAYGKCSDPGCRCVHAPLTRESEIKRFIDENEEYFHQAFKKFPGITIPPPLLKALTEKFGPPPSPPTANPVNNSSPPGNLRPMPPPKFFPPPQNHFPVPISPTQTPPVFGFPPQPGHPFPHTPNMPNMTNMPNMFPPGGLHAPQGFPGQHMFPGQSMFNGVNNGMPLVPPMNMNMNMNHNFGMMNNINNMNNMMNMMNHAPGNLGFPQTQMPFGMYPGNTGNGFPGNNQNMINHHNSETKQIDIKMKSPEKKSPPKPLHIEKRKDKYHKSPEGTNSSKSSKSSPSSAAKEVSQELAKLSKRKSNENKTIERNTSADQETDSATPESKPKEDEWKRVKQDSTAEKIARLVELFKAKKQKTEPLPEENSQQSPIKKQEVIPVIEDNISIRKEVQNENNITDGKMNKMVEEKPAEIVKENERPVEVESNNGKKSIFENGSINEALLKQLKSALPTDQAQSASNIKDLVNMYLKLGKKPGF